LILAGGQLHGSRGLHAASPASSWAEPR
jgi:hypothetical protein